MVRCRRRSAALLFGLALGASGCAGDPVAPEALDFAPLYLVTANAIPDEFIVVLKEPAPDGPTGVAARAGVQPSMEFQGVIRGFAARLRPGQIARLRRDPDVAFIEQDRTISVDGTQTLSDLGDPWGLDRLDQTTLPLSRSYHYAHTGAGVNAYIIDTGIDLRHPEFGGRAVNVYDAMGGDGRDCNGHGTAVAAVVGGGTFGVAKEVRLRGVRVTDCKGHGKVSAMVRALDWVRVNRIDPAVANVSISAPFSPAFNRAVTNLVRSGVFVAAGAGNDAEDACDYSPAAAAAVVTVAASTRTDTRAAFSNSGRCVTLYAPGDRIRTAHLDGRSATWSGTSFAAPHVTGVAALYKSKYGDAAPAVIATWLLNNARLDRIAGNPAHTPNRLLFKATL